MEDSGEYADFVAAVDAAEAQAERKAVVMVQMGMREDPRLCMTFLERRFPARWQRRPNPDTTPEKRKLPEVVNIRFVKEIDEDGKEIKSFEYISDEELDEQLARRAAQQGATNGAPPGNDEPSPPTAATVLPPAR